MAAPRHATTVIPIVNGFLVAGGYRKQEGYYDFTDVVEKFTFGSNSWQSMDPVLAPRQNITSVIIPKSGLTVGFNLYSIKVVMQFVINCYLHIFTLER